MEAATLQPPKTGKSRFSKALPAPPSFLKALKGLPSSPQPSKTHLPPARKPLPTATAGPPAPPAPPAKEGLSSPVSPSNTNMKPLDSPLPPPPLTTTKPSPSLPSIPRRPVAAVSPGLASPDDSPLSSLLSAYTDSNRSSDSTHLSSNDGGTPVSGGQEYHKVSPKFDNSPSFTTAATSPSLDELFFAPLTIQQPGDNHASQGQESRGGPPKTPDGKTKQLPLPPFKDFDIGTQSNPTGETSLSAGLTQSSPVVSPEPTLTQSPQSQPQIWRRRSLKAEKNLAVTELKLVSSNGSTTSASTVPTPAPPPKDPSPTLLQADHSISGTTRSPLPTGPNAAFPGRNIRPVASRQQLVEDGPDSTGQEASRVKNTLKKADRGEDAGVTRRASPPSATTHSKTSSISSPVRLPTPEYDTGDFKAPIVETIISPVSPASSPELPSEPRQQRPVQEAKGVRHIKSNSSFSSSQSTAKAAPSHNLAQKPSLQGLGHRPPVGLPSNPAASRKEAPQPQSQFPARTTSKAPTSSPSNDRPTPAPKGRTISEVGSIETIKASTRPEQFLPAPETRLVREEAREDDSTDHPGAERFPRNWWKKEIPRDTIFQLPPISEKHHRCLTRHRLMPEVRNIYYPVACQACGLKDTSFRYTCSSCNLRVCKSCRMTLGKFKGDLQRLMRHNDSVIVEQSTEMEYDHEEAAIQNGRVNATASAARQ
ncbi:hypothetical protein GE09DRAFT_115859 [Coniochaeta sp. 2T2.1]|nr:hypothetical protein GE09DRAFT_115859 [Coniochaeta sp. 2T2.1]